MKNAKKYAKYSQYIKYYGQELNTSTYNLARMNMFLHGIPAENQNLRNGDTLDGDWPTDEETDFCKNCKIALISKHWKFDK